MFNSIFKLSASAGTFGLVIFAAVIDSCSTAHSIQSHEIKTTQLYDTLLEDRDGNGYPVKVLADGNLWMITNLKINIPGSYCYGDSIQNCERYGRLYTWKSAEEGCNLLGKDWHLPTSPEWQQLIKLYGTASTDPEEIRKGAYKNLLNGEASGFNALLGGGRDPNDQYARLNAHGFYWTSTENDSGTAIFYNFASGSQALYRQDSGEKARAFSVRCVNSPDSLK